MDVSTSQRKINVIKSVPNEDNALLMAFMPNGYNELESLTEPNCSEALFPVGILMICVLISN